jgi:glycosyltransferase involved in cell wall biosynthesis
VAGPPRSGEVSKLERPPARPHHRLGNRSHVALKDRPPQANIRIVIPAFNESARIAPTLTDYCTHFGPAATILVVANGCTDETSRVVRQAQQFFANLQLMEFIAKIGKGGAIRVGLATGREEFVGFVDADGSTRAAEFGRLYAIARENQAQGVIGSRWLTGARVEPKQPPLRRLASRTFNHIVRCLFALKFQDTQCGAKIFRRRALRSILRQLELCDFAADIEILWHLDRAGHVILEIPTVWADKAGTKVQILRVSWNMLKSVLYLRLRQSPMRQAPLLERLRGSPVLTPELIRRAVPLNVAGSIQH